MLLLFSIILFVHNVYSDVKIWKYDTLISNKDNVVQEEEQLCSGLIFPENLEAPAILDNISVTDIVLPRYGKIYLQNNMRIILGDTANKCIKIKPLEYRSWLNPRNWYFKRLNNAVPHTNRVPCKDDEVVIRRYPAFAIEYPQMDIEIKQFNIQNHSLEHDELQDFLDSKNGYNLFRNHPSQTRRNIIKIKEDMDCYYKYGCTCQNSYKTLNEYVCSEFKNDPIYRPRKKCYAPIEVIGHCEPFCGSAIKIQITRQFNVNYYKNLLSSLEKKMDTHMGRVEADDGRQYFQLVLSDSGEYTGDNNDIAERFYKKYVEGRVENGIKTSVFLKSEAPYYPESQLNTVNWLVFGTLLGCLFIFTTIFVLNSEKAQEYRPLLLRKLKQRSKSTVKSMREQMQPFRFARFENREDGGLSLAGSIISLDKSFENPMYGTRTSGSKTTDMECIPATEVTEELSEIIEEASDYSDVNEGHQNLMSTAMENLSENINKIEKLIEK